MQFSPCSSETPYINPPSIILYVSKPLDLSVSLYMQKTTTNLYQDFSTVWSAMQLLFIVATGEAWAEYASQVASGGKQPEFIVMTFFVVFVM